MNTNQTKEECKHIGRPVWKGKCEECWKKECGEKTLNSIIEEKIKKLRKKFNFSGG